ncbi:glycosyltransferase [Chloroflexota bacterium]
MTDRQISIAMLSAHSCPLGDIGAKDTGGMSIYIRELAREIGQRGHSVDVYTRVHDPNDEQIYSLGRNARLIHLNASDNLEINKLALYSHLPDFACNLENFRKCHDLHYDLIFSHYWLSGWAGRYLQCWWHVPHIITFHTLGAVKNSIGIGEDEPELRIETERDLVKNCQRIIATTEREKGELIRHYGAGGEKISVVPCGVNLDLFKPIDRASARRELGLDGMPIIVFAGRIDPLKGIDQLLCAMTYLENGYRPRLLIIGGDEHSQGEMARLKRLARDLKIGSSCSFLGRIEHEKLPYFYSAASACIVPSYYENFGLVAIESLACGTPVVATDVGNLRGIIRQGETGYVVKDNSPRELAGGIDILLARPEPSRQSVLAIRSSVAGFSWANIARSVIAECRTELVNYAARVS